MAQLLDPVRLSTSQNIIFPSVTFTDSTDLVTRASHGLADGAAITFNNISDTTGILVDTTYYVINSTLNTFQLASTLGGTAIDLTGDGTGKLAPIIMTNSSGAIDGIAPVAGMRILLKAQTDKTENGIYVIESNDRLIRAVGFKTGDMIPGGTAVFIQDGSIFSNTGWVVSSQFSEDNDITTVLIGTDQVLFERFSVNLKLDTQDVPSAIILRSAKGYPLTIQELDNNFKYVSQTLNLKLNVSDFTRTAVKNKLNTIVTGESKSIICEDNALNAWQLRGLSPSIVNITDTQTVTLRDTDGSITATSFKGSVIGNATSATLAANATLANNVSGIVAVENGGTGANTHAAARNALGVIYKGGDSMVGKLTMSTSINSAASMNIPKGIDPAVGILVDGDIWTTTDAIKYRLNGTTYQFAPTNSPVFIGNPTITDNPNKSSNNNSLASTYFVQLHVTDLNTAINARAPIESPTFTGNAKAVTPATSTIDTSIATTAFVVNKLNEVLPSYFRVGPIGPIGPAGPIGPVGPVGPSASVGVGQTWQDVTANRSSGTTYTNNTGKPIMVNVFNNAVDAGFSISAIVGGVQIGFAGGGAGGDGRRAGTVSFIVPASTTYTVMFSVYGLSAIRWVELR